MKPKIVYAGICLVALSICATFPLFPQQVRYGTGNWDTETLGNHRAVLNVAEKADVVRAHIPWRLRDSEPEKKNILIIEASTGSRVTNLLRLDVNRAFGDILFQAQVPGTYYVYYMPFQSKGRNYPVVTYPTPEDGADPAWKKRAAAALTSSSALIEANLVEIQACDEFNSLYPMEVIATPAETSALLKAYSGNKFLLFPEDRRNPIRMSEDLPQKWIIEGPRAEFAGDAERGEYYAFQAGLFATAADIRNIAVRFTDLRAGSRSIPSSAFRSVNTGGINWDGTAFKKTIAVKKGHVQALWFGVQIPEEATPGTYKGQVSIMPDGMPAQSISLAITVKPGVAAEAGNDEPWRHSRLRWLDSMLAFDDEIVRPYTPMRVTQNRIEILGRRLTLATSGFPAQVESFYSPEVTRIQGAAKSLLADPIELIVED